MYYKLNLKQVVLKDAYTKALPSHHPCLPCKTWLTLQEHTNDDPSGVLHNAALWLWEIN